MYFFFVYLQDILLTNFISLYGCAKTMRMQKSNIYPNGKINQVVINTTKVSITNLEHQVFSL